MVNASLILRDTNLLYPPFWAAFSQCLEAAKKDGHKLVVFETFRAPARQQSLYNQGRVTAGSIITQARPWQSWHQYGMAVDIAMFDGRKYGWNFDPAKIARYFEHELIKWGGANDGPHYQYAKLPKISSAQAISAEANSVLAFWATLA